MSERDATPALSIGVMVGGTGQDARRWGDEAMDLARRVKALRVDVESPLNVNVVYHVGGDVVPVDFSGVRTGRYSSADKLLLVQAAVPEAPENHSKGTLIDLLDSAIVEAERFRAVEGHHRPATRCAPCRRSQASGAVDVMATRRSIRAVIVAIVLAALVALGLAGSAAASRAAQGQSSAAMTSVGLRIYAYDRSSDMFAARGAVLVKRPEAGGHRGRWY